MTRIAFFGAAVAAMTASVALAQAPAAPGPMTRAEMQQRVQQRFAQMDTNHDGSLTQAELVAAGVDANMATAMMQRMDTNHDGKITLEELTARQLAAFDAADTNHDGILTPEERAAAMAKMQPQAAPAAPAAPH